VLSDQNLIFSSFIPFHSSFHLFYLHKIKIKNWIMTKLTILLPTCVNGYPKQYSWHDISLCITIHPIHTCTAFLALVIVRHWVRTLTIIANLRIFALLKTHSTVELVCHHISWQSESGLESGCPSQRFWTCLLFLGPSNINIFLIFIISEIKG